MLFRSLRAIQRGIKRRPARLSIFDKNRFHPPPHLIPKINWERGQDQACLRRKFFRHPISGCPGGPLNANTGTGIHTWAMVECPAYGGLACAGHLRYLLKVYLIHTASLSCTYPCHNPSPKLIVAKFKPVVKGKCCSFCT